LFKTKRENINKNKTDYNPKTTNVVSQTKSFFQPKSIFPGWFLFLLLLKKAVIISALSQRK